MLVKSSDVTDKILNYLLLIYAFSLPISRTAVSGFSLIIPMIWLYRCHTQKTFNLTGREKKLLFFLSLIPIFLTLSLLWSENIWFGLRNIKMFFYWLMIPVIISMGSKSRYNSLINSFIYGTTFSCIFSYLIKFEIINYENVTIHAGNPTPFMNDIEYSVFLALCIILLAQKLLKNIAYRETKSIIYTTLNALFVTVILFSISGRTGQVALLLTIPLFIFIQYKINLRTLIISPLLIVMIFLIGYHTSSAFKGNILYAAEDFNKTLQGNYDSSLGLRASAWAVAFKVIKDKPVIGCGVGDYMDDFKIKMEKFPKYKASDWFPHIHNQYIQITMQAGVIGLIICAIYWLKYLTIPMADKEARIIHITFASIYLLSCLMEPLWMKQFSTSLFALFTGITLGISSYENSKPIAPPGITNTP